MCSDIHDEEITLADFDVVRADRNHSRGGGVALFLKSGLRYSVIGSVIEVESV